MKFSIKNLGPLKNADIVLNNLTIITGQNNSGKTFLAHIIYAIIRRHTEDFFPFYFEFSESKGVFNAIVKGLTTEGEITLNEEDLAKMTKQANQLISKLSNELDDTFNVPNVYFKGSSITCEILEPLTFMDFKTIHYPKLLIQDIDGDKIKITFTEKKANYEDDSGSLYVLFSRLITDKLARTFIFTSERLGISLFYRDLDKGKAELFEQMQKFFQKGSKDYRSKDEYMNSIFGKRTSRYSYAITKHIDFVRDIYSFKNRKSKIKYIENIINEFDNMSGGKVFIDEDYLSFKLNESGKNLLFHTCSSSIREVSDIQTYLEHLSKPKDIVIIDEPESHLSPSNQIKLTRIIAMCVNAGIKMIITTHSDYLLREINNLLALYSSKPSKKKVIMERYNINKNMLLKPTMVSEYLITDGVSEECKSTELGFVNNFINECISMQNNFSSDLW